MIILENTKVYASLIIYANASDKQFYRCIESLKYQTYKNFEVIIIDNAWSHLRESYIKNSNLSCHVEHINKPKTKRYYMEICSSRNIANEKAKGDILIFSNDLMLFPYRFIENHCIYHKKTSNLCLIGSIEYINNDTIESESLTENFESKLTVIRDKESIAKYNYRVFKSEKLYNDLFPWAKYTATNLSISKKLMDKVKGFQEDVSIYAPSDSDFIYRLYSEGIKIVWAKEIKAYQQDHVLYPTVRWRARSCDYLPYKYQTEELYEWLNLRQLERNIIDYNRYHETKISLSQNYEDTIYEYYNKEINKESNQIEYCFIILLDDLEESDDKIIDLINVLKDIEDAYKYELIIVPLTPEYNSELHAQLQKETYPFHIRYNYWSRESEWRNMLQSKKLINIVKYTTKNEKVLNFIKENESKIEEQRAKFSSELIMDIVNNVSGSYSKIIRISEFSKESIIFNNNEWGLQDTVSRKKPVEDFGISYEQKYDDYEKGFSLPPNAISFRLTHKCNLRCKMCGQWGASGNFREKQKEFVDAILDIDTLKKIVDETVKIRPGMFYIWGGEPFLHPNYIDLIRYIKEKNIYCTTTTNGTLLKKYAKEICSIGTEFIRVSIDGTEKIHNEIRGSKNCFQQTIEGIREINDIKNRYNLTYPIIECDSVILPDNYKYIEEYLEQMNKIEGVHSVNFSHPIYATKEVGKRHVAEFRDRFNINATSWEGFVMDVSQVDTGELINIIKRVKEKEYNFPINFDPPMRSLEDVHLHYNDIELLYKNRFCTVPWIWVEIHPNGLVSFCEDFCDYYIGDVKKDSLLDIWNNAEARKYRVALLETNKFPICSHCGLLCHDADY